MCCLHAAYPFPLFWDASVELEGWIQCAAGNGGTQTALSQLGCLGEAGQQRKYFLLFFLVCLFLISGLQEKLYATSFSLVFLNSLVPPIDSTRCTSAGYKPTVARVGSILIFHTWSACQSCFLSFHTSKYTRAFLMQQLERSLQTTS